MAEMIPASRFRASEGVDEWNVLSDGANTFYRTGSFAESARFVRALGELGLDEHPPAVDIRADGVTVRLITVVDDHFGMSTDDVEAARRITALAREHGLTGDPSAVQSILIIPGATDTAAVMPFWRAVLGYDPRPDSPDEDLVDPRDRGPAFWFEGMEEPRGDGGGAIHIAVWVSDDQAEARVKAALEAGGRMMRDDFAPSWWTLADPAGNEADIATLQHRD